MVWHFHILHDCNSDIIQNIYATCDIMAIFFCVPFDMIITYILIEEKWYSCHSIESKLF